MASYEDLDKLLILISKQKRPPCINEGDLRNEIKKNVDIDIDTDYLVPMLTQLVKDEYILRDHRRESVKFHSVSLPELTFDAYYYEITFSGKLFISNGGYAGKFIRENAESTRLLSVERTQIVNANRLTHLTAILAAVGIPPCVYYVFELFDYYQQHSLNVQYVAYFVSGFLLALMLFLVLKLILGKPKHKVNASKANTY